MGNFSPRENPGFRLEGNEVHIWRLEPEPTVEHYLELLSADERERAARFRFPHLTHSFVADHGRIRLILGDYAGVDARGLEFVCNEFGKPEVANLSAPLRFNLSHTEGMSMLAVALDTAVGIDIEAVRPMDDWLGVAQSHFSPREIAVLNETEQSDRQNAFFRCWTRKEAFLKAHGRGLSIPLDSFAVSVAAEATPALLECTWGPEETKRWSLMSLDVGTKFAGALAVEGKDWKIRYFDWVEDRSLLPGAGI